ncbi:60S ribosomal protein L18 [Tupaia chinensis]|uniref:60S ribosomal protein L18 n=1 Tax=Tupaia chinensis TaxID=246437 RepID=L9L5T5_TUPCH|nr:60S ribosomal protein L18 [Tupaia chinensis]
MVVGTITDDVHIQEGKVSKLKVYALRVTSRAAAASSRLGARSLPLTIWPWTLLRAVALSYSPALARAMRYTSISARPLEPRGHNHTKACVCSKGLKFECARGRCASRDYKN